MALDMVDCLILETFKKLNESFFDDASMPTTLNDLTRDQLYEGIILLLWNCDPATRSVLTFTKLPHNMATRFRAAMNVVEVIKNVGIRDEISYQTLLYGQAKEIRNVFIGLIEKLPNEAPMITKEESPIVQLIRKAVSRADYTTYPPHVAKYCFVQKRSWKPPWGVCRQFPFTGSSGNINVAAKGGLEWQRLVVCACLEASQYGSFDFAPSKTHKVHESMRGNLRDAEVMAQKLMFRPPKPALPTRKPLLPKKPASLQPENEKVNEEVSRLASEIDRATNELGLVKTRIEQKRRTLEKEQNLQTEKSTKLKALKDQEAKIDSRLLKLIESPETLATVTEYVENVEEIEKRAQELQTRWINVKVKKDEEILEARRLYDAKIKEGSCVSETLKFLRSADELKSQLPKKESKLKKLILKAEALEKTPVNRSLYTKRIFEMVGSIKKQRDEIEKGLVDNAQIQKEIKSLNGKLDRTFTAVEERLYREAQRDTLMQKAYRLLVKIHEEYANVVAVIEESGKAEREIDETNDLIFTMQQKGLDDMLEKILNDWMVIKKENKELTKLLDVS